MSAADPVSLLIWRSDLKVDPRLGVCIPRDEWHRNGWRTEDYIVWTSDSETREMRSSLLYRVMVVVPPGDEAVDGDGRGRLPLLAIPTTHLPSHSNQIVHKQENSLHPNPLKPSDLNSLTTTAPRRDETEGRRWLCQARVDYLACSILLDSAGVHPSVCCNACFMAHEVAEKSLKAGRFSRMVISSMINKAHFFLVGRDSTLARYCCSQNGR
ncbi:hypothetical protein EMCRGX_G031628 [Ephydatia muelleri]